MINSTVWSRWPEKEEAETGFSSITVQRASLAHLQPYSSNALETIRVKRAGNHVDQKHWQPYESYALATIKVKRTGKHTSQTRWTPFWSNAPYHTGQTITVKRTASDGAEVANWLDGPERPCEGLGLEGLRFEGLQLEGLGLEGFGSQG